MNKKFYKLELEIHGGNVASTLICLKKNCDKRLLSTVFEDMEEGIIKRHTIKLVYLREKLQAFKTLWWLFSVVKKIFAIYSDLVKDIIFLVSVAILMGGYQPLFQFPRHFISVVFACQLLSIILPLVLGSFLVARDIPQEIFKDIKKTGIKRKLLQLTIMLGCFFIPAILVNLYESSKRKTDRSFKEKMGLDKYLQTITACKKLKEKILWILQLEFGFEVINQASGSIILLLSTSTSTPTTSGLERMFEKSPFLGIPAEWMLIASVILSCKSSFSTVLKMNKVAKPYFPTSSKALIYSYALFGTSKRIIITILYFAPFMGLFDILYHHKYEQKEWTVNRQNPRETLELYGGVTNVSWSMIDRWTWTNDGTRKPPSYDLYTGLDLSVGFVIYWAIVIVHTSLVYMVKKWTVKKERTIPTIDFALHSFCNIHVPMPFQDWDTSTGGVTEHKNAFNQVKKEIVFTALVNFIVHCCQLVPLLYTGREPSY